MVNIQNRKQFFFNLNIKLIHVELKRDLFVEPTDTHHFLDPTSLHPHHSKKGIPYSAYCQALRLYRFSSDNENFHKR